MRQDVPFLEDMNYEEAMSFLEDIKKYGSCLGLDTIKALMHELGDVQDKVPTIHIGGTNGKGSVGAMLSSILTESGYKVGWFNSPDVFSYEEEFRICGDPIGKERLAEIFTEVKAACEKVAAGSGRNAHHHPTRFEVETAAAFLWFNEENCDIAIIEVGMGGATDATNVIEKPLVSVLTSISLDHMHSLGYTLPEIARVKAGIIKPGSPVVTVEQEPKVMDVIMEQCREEGASLYRADSGLAEDFSYVEGVSSFNWNETRITLGLHAPVQTENASCALKVIEVLRERYPECFGDISDEDTARALARTSWPGRYEQITLEGPAILLDGAHNEAAAQRLREALDADFPERRIIYIMGVLADKDFDAMARIMFNPGDRVYTVTTSSPRALPAQELAAQLARHDIDAIPCETAQDAVTNALNEAGEDDVILAFGSLYCLGEIRDAILISK